MIHQSKTPFIDSEDRAVTTLLSRLINTKRKNTQGLLTSRRLTQKASLNCSFILMAVKTVPTQDPLSFKSLHSGMKGSRLVQAKRMVTLSGNQPSSSNTHSFDLNEEELQHISSHHSWTDGHLTLWHIDHTDLTNDTQLQLNKLLL